MKLIYLKRINQVDIELATVNEIKVITERDKYYRLVKAFSLNSVFQSDVLKIRSELNIPLDGFCIGEYQKIISKDSTFNEPKASPGALLYLNDEVPAVKICVRDFALWFAKII